MELSVYVVMLNVMCVVINENVVGGWKLISSVVKFCGNGFYFKIEKKIVIFESPKLWYLLMASIVRLG